MIQKIITKEELYKHLNSLIGEFKVIGPKELANKGIFYEVLDNSDGIYLGDMFTTEPIKKFFLPASQQLFKYEYKDGKKTLQGVLLDNQERIVIGARPCETRALTLLDKVFDSEYKDDFYIHNRRRTVIIGLSCANPDRNCFCTSIEGSPVESRGMDAIIFAKDNKFIMEIITDKAKKIFSNIGRDLSETQKEALESEKQKRKDLVTTKLKMPQNLDRIFEHAYWEQVSRPCLSCGICTFLCPTCHCFDMVDEDRQRLRCYDGCAFPDFTLEASGVNPRPTTKERYRQRVFHKFDYFKQNFGENLCVGCGRCIRHCPVKMDIRDIVEKAPVSENR